MFWTAVEGNCYHVFKFASGNVRITWKPVCWGEIQTSNPLYVQYYWPLHPDVRLKHIQHVSTFWLHIVFTCYVPVLRLSAGNKMVFIMDTGYVFWAAELNFEVLFRWTPDIKVWTALPECIVLEYVLLYLHLPNMHHGLDFLDTGPWLPLVWPSGHHISDVLGSNLGSRGSSAELSSLTYPSWKNPATITSHVCFVTYSFQFIFLYSSHYLVLYRTSYRQCN
jgi:hypothetical protein